MGEPGASEVCAAEKRGLTYGFNGYRLGREVWAKLIGKRRTVPEGELAFINDLSVLVAVVAEIGWAVDSIRSEDSMFLVVCSGCGGENKEYIVKGVSSQGMVQLHVKTSSNGDLSGLYVGLGGRIGTLEHGFNAIVSDSKVAQRVIQELAYTVCALSDGAINPPPRQMLP